MNVQGYREYNAAVAFAIEASKARSWRVLRHARVRSLEDWLDSPEGQGCLEVEEDRTTGLESWRSE